MTSKSTPSSMNFESRETLRSHDNRGKSEDLHLQASLDSSASAPEKPIGPPDGGLVAWLQVVASFIMFFNNWGLLNTFGAYQAYYQADLLSNHSSFDISWIGTLQGCLLIVVGALSGPLYDKGYFRTMLAVASLGLCFGNMMLSISSEYYQVLLTQGLLNGFCEGLMYIPSIAIVSSYFTTRRSIAIGLAASGGSIGGVIYPIVFRQLQPKIGFAWTTRTIGFIILGTQLIALALAKPFDTGAQKRVRGFIDRSALREAPFMLFTLSGLFIFAGFYVPIIYTPTYAETVLHESADLSFYLLAVVNAAATFGRITPAFIAHYIGPEKMMLAGNVSAIVISLSWIAVRNLGGFIAFLVVYGFVSGIVVTMPAATLPLLCPSMDVIGTRLAMAWLPAGVGVLISTPVAASIAKPESGVFLGAQIWVGVVYFVGALLQVGPVLHIIRKRKTSS